MNDPRRILMEKLTEIGFSQSDAIIIAMDVGSSQALVNDEYLNNFRYSDTIP